MKTKYQVDYYNVGSNGRATARFSLWADAIAFAITRHSADVLDSTGILAQFRQGKVTREFASSFAGMDIATS